MVFASPIFLFLFLPLVLLLYALAPRRARNAVLLLASLVFYTWGEGRGVLFVLLSVLWNWCFGLALQRATGASARRWLLGLGVGCNLALLIVFKYADFIVANANGAFAWLGIGASFQPPGIALLLGISFFTFHAISYLVDIYRRSARAESNLGNYALYIMLFPQLIAGPIIRWKQICDQFRRREVAAADFSWGASRFVVGLAKKMLIANPLGAVADAVFAAPPGELSASVAWLGIACYTLQIYFDFSGYSDMAIGLMRMFGFRILENFDYPYIARSIREFWRRWHISLSSFFRDYVYIPLGGNHGSMTRTCINTLLVFAISGLWHGANWTFVAWGVWHGALVCLEILLLGRALDRIGRWAHLYGLLAVMAGWVLFRSPTIGHAGQYFMALAGMGEATDTAPMLNALLGREVAAALVVGAIASTPIVPRLAALLARFANLRFAGQYAALCVLFVLSAGALAAGSFNPFIYFRF